MENFEPIKVKIVTKKERLYSENSCKVINFDVADLNLLNREIYLWTVNTPVVIAAPTGVGKTTWILKGLLPEVRRSGKKMLLLTNRTALSEQTKKQLLSDVLGRYVGKAEYYKMKLQFESEFENGKVGMYDFGPAIIMTMQAFYKTDKKKLSNYNIGAVVVDEAHFFKADALFNYTTKKIFEDIFSYFNFSLKIFVTATPQNILPDIIEKGLALKPFDSMDICRCPKKYANLYDFVSGMIGYQDIEGSYYRAGTVMYMFPDIKKDYKMISVEYDEDYLKALTPLIDEVNKSDFKAVLFINDKKAGRVLADKFDNAIFIDSASKNAGIVSDEYICYKRLIQNEKFDTKVLICTSVLDNGININDDTVRYVFIDADDESEFLQMLGRVRFSRLKSRPQLNVYFFKYNRDYFTKKMSYFSNTLAELKFFSGIKMYEEQVAKYNYLVRNNCRCAQFISLDSKHKFVINEFAIVEMERLLTYVNNLVNLFDSKNIRTDIDEFDFREFLLEHIRQDLTKQYKARTKNKNAAVPVFTDEYAQFLPIEETELYDQHAKELANQAFGENAYLFLVSSWLFHKYSISQIDDYNDTMLNLEKFLCSLSKQEFIDGEDGKKEFLEKISECFNKVGARFSKQLKTINKELKKIGIKYEVISQQSNKLEGRPMVWCVKEVE